MLELETVLERAKNSIDEFTETLAESRLHERANTSIGAMLVDVLGERFQVSDVKLNSLHEELRQVIRRAEFESQVQTISRNIADFQEQLEAIANFLHTQGPNSSTTYRIGS